ncbi:MAG: hypothetical protein R6W96_08785 [Clostridia bacterium]
MGLHEYDKDMKSDHDFVKGQLRHLVEGNKCRLLDGRRTPGIIEEYMDDCAMFRWRIMNFEDRGKCWELPVEDIVKFQFDTDAQLLDEKHLLFIKETLKKHQKPLTIWARKKDRDASEADIGKVKLEAMSWLEENSCFLQAGGRIDFSFLQDHSLLRADFLVYMKSAGLEEEEKKTAENMVLNPHSGEWIKGLGIVLAEMGLVSFKGGIPRTPGIFKGMGEKGNRRRYLVHRLAFIRALFGMQGIGEVVVYRGMSCEHPLRDVPRMFLSCTFSREVAEAFSDFDRDSMFKNSYLLKLTCPPEALFMTCLETEAMNRQYREAEALLLHGRPISI